MSETPERIGPYVVEGRLGVGGMGETYVAVRRGPGGFEQRVCLKRIRGDVADDPELVRQFLAEARTMARLRHAAIAQVLDFGEDAGQYYLALELVEGMDLRALLERVGRLDAETLLQLALDVTTALGVAHRARDGAVIHRDISTSNVLVSGEGEIKLTDFGIARSLDGPAHTRSGVVKGKVPYIAPEYARTGKVDERCDLYSLGVTLYECAAGERPHDGETDLDTLERAARGQRVPLAQRCPELPAELAAIIERLIAADPEQRPRDTTALLNALEALPPPPPGTRRRLGERVRGLVSGTDPPPRRATPAELAPTAPADARENDRPQPAPTRTSVAAAPPSHGPSRRALSTLLLSTAIAAAVFLMVDRQRPAPASEPGAAVAPTEVPTGPATAPGSTQPEATADRDAVEPIVRLPEGKSAPRPDDEAAPAQEPTTAHLEVVVFPFGRVSVDGKPWVRSPLRIELQPGTHHVAAKSSDETFERKVTLDPGERRRIELR